MLTALADAQPPPPPLVQACSAHFEATGSLVLMDPVIASLSKDQVVHLLPKLLMQLPEQRLRLLYRRLALASHGREAMFAPVELLVLLHKVTSAPDMPQAAFKQHKDAVTAAVDRAMRTPEVFPVAVMQTVSGAHTRATHSDRGAVGPMGPAAAPCTGGPRHNRAAGPQAMSAWEEVDLGSAC